MSAFIKEGYIMIDRCIMTQLGPVITTLRVLVAGCVIITTAGFAGDTAGISVIQTDDRLTVGISPDGSVGSVKLDGVIYLCRVVAAFSSKKCYRRKENSTTTDIWSER
jgi:hypothetical protein